MPNIDGVELIVIAKGEKNDKGQSWRLRLVQWVVDGQSKSVKLEKRRFFLDAYNEEKTGKNDGLTIQDLTACKPHWAKIMELMKNPPVVKQKTEAVKAAEAAQTVFPDSKVVEDNDEIPF